MQCATDTLLLPSAAPLLRTLARSLLRALFQGALLCALLLALCFRALCVCARARVRFVCMLWGVVGVCFLRPIDGVALIDH